MQNKFPQLSVSLNLSTSASQFRKKLVKKIKEINIEPLQEENETEPISTLLSTDVQQAFGNRKC